MKVLVVSDIHDDDTAAKIAQVTENPDLVLDCGDHHRIGGLFDMVQHFYIHGNHVPTHMDVSSRDFLLPHKIAPGIIYKFSQGVESIRFAGIDGHYSSRDALHSVKRSDIEALELIPEGSIDVFLTHESPITTQVRDEQISALSKYVLQEINRIKPRIVFSGHLNKFQQYFTEEGIDFIHLNDMGHGYLVLEKIGERMNYRNVISKFRS